MKKSTVSASSLANKTAVLEERLDGIVEMLQRSHVPQGMIPSPPQDEVQNEDRIVSTLRATPGTTSYHPIHPPPIPASGTSGLMSHVVHGVGGAHKTTPSPSATSVTGDYPLETEDELDDCLEQYRTQMVPFFPVVCVEPEVTVKELRENRPCK
jgi:hypothetical protein